MTLKGTIRVYLNKESCSTSALKPIYIRDTRGHWRGLLDMREMYKLVEAQAEPLTSGRHGTGNAIHRAAWKLTSRVDIGVDNLKSAAQHLPASHQA